ncbi:MAG: glutamate synthase large subunit, partial [Actinomycetota bacterium]
VFAAKVNYELVDLEPLDATDVDFLRTTITAHTEETGSTVGGRILGAWDAEVSHFRKVMPRDFKRVLTVMEESRRQGLSEEQTLQRVMESTNG